MGLIEGALIILAGILIGRVLPGRRRPKASKAPSPVCGCTHHHAFHDPKTGECHGTVRGKVASRDRYGSPEAWERVRCSCRRYSGPEPLPEMFATEIAGGAGA